MPNPRKILELVLMGRSDSNIEFDDVRRLLLVLGFNERIKGSHHIFTKEGVIEIINIQRKNNKAKAYQVKQIRNIILSYRLGKENE
ncbi:MAG: type II toxin-antitoxin system HicA family toxin [Pyrinomonadaceae bacterium]